MPNPVASNPVRLVAVETNSPIHTIVDSEVIINDSTPVDVAVTTQINTVAPPYQSDAGGRLRVSQLTTLGDYKPVANDLSLFYDTQVIGGATHSWAFEDAYFTMGVTADGDAVVKQTYQRHPYSSGKSQFPETTCINFQPEADAIKRTGYFSSGFVAPFTTLFDGMYLESSEGTVKLKADRYGVNTATIPQAEWDIYTTDPSFEIDWSAFNVFAFDFLWLGGTGIRLFIIQDNTPILLHKYAHAGNVAQTMVRSPNQPIRWELRSTGGAATFHPVCAQVSSEGEISATGIIRSANMSDVQLDANTAGVRYAALGIRLASTAFDTAIDVTDISAFSSTTTNFLWELVLNPTVAGVFTYVGLEDSAIEYATGATANTVTEGYVIASGYAASRAEIERRVESARRLGASLDGTPDALVLVATPLSANMDFLGSLTWRERV